MLDKSLTMVVVSLLFALLFSTANSQINTEEPPYKNLSLCVRGILEKYFYTTKTITYINLSEDNDILLKDLYDAELTIVNKDVEFHTDTLNQAYFITATNDIEFNEAIHLTHEQFWNPHARFIIVVRELVASQLKPIFDILLKLHVRNVIVVNGTETGEIFSYNPFENTACGNYYTKITEYGQCLQVESDMFQDKAISLRNCTFRVAVPHAPPFSINPKKLDYKTENLGAEQFVFDMISQVEGFKYNFSYDIDPEVFSVISSNMTVTGPLVLVHNNDTDVILGAIFLTTTRFNKFSVLYGHLDNVDLIKVIVKSAKENPHWKNFYLEFPPLVWFLLFVYLVLYSFLIMLLLKPKDKFYIVMILLDNLVQHGAKIKLDTSSFVRALLIIWVWFAYLMNCYYTSSLVSLTTKPSWSYQIQNQEDLKSYGLKPCMSPVMVGFNRDEHLSVEEPETKSINGCDTIRHSIEKVSKNDDLYTIVPHAFFLFNEHKFDDEYGESLVYVFDKTQSHIIYGIYFYKGFPFLHRFITWVLRFRETGLVDKNVDDIFYEREIKYHPNFKEFESRFAIPWWIFGVGVFSSCVAFIFEIIFGYKVDQDTMVNLPYLE